MKNSLKKSNSNKKMSVNNQEQPTCCVSFEPTKHDPCNHLVHESCYSQVPTCPMCRAPLGPTDNSDINEVNQRMLEAAEAGHEDSIKLMLSQGANNYNRAMFWAARNNHLNIIELMIEKGADVFSGFVVGIAFHNKLNIVQLMIEKGANDFNTASYILRNFEWSSKHSEINLG